MKRQGNLPAPFALPAAAILAAISLLIAGCNGVSSVGNSDLGGEKQLPIVEFSGTAEVRNEAPQVIRLKLASDVGTSFEFRGTTGLTLTAGSGYPANLKRTTKENGILGVIFEAGNPREALIQLNGWVSFADKDLVLTYNKAAGELYSNGALCNSFTIPVTNLVDESNTGPAEPDAAVPAPILTAAAVYDSAPKNVKLTFDRDVIITSVVNFKVIVNNTTEAEVASAVVSSTGIVLELRSGIGYGDKAKLNYTKGEIEGNRVISVEGKELEALSIDIDNNVIEGTDPNGGSATQLTPDDSHVAPPGAGATLSGLKVSLPRINWLQNEEIANAFSVTAIYSDSGIKVLSPSDYTLNPAKPTAYVDNNQGITVVYRDEASRISVSKKIEINVLAPSTTLPKLAAIKLTVPRESWVAGEVFVPTVTAVYEDSSYGTIPEGKYTLTPAYPTKSVEENLIVSASYTEGGIERSNMVAISVKASKNTMPALSGIVATMAKKSWMLNEPFNVNVEAFYADGTGGVVEQGYTFNPISPTVASGHDQTVRISYRGQSCSLIIDVIDPDEEPNFELTVSSIQAMPVKPTFLHNNPFAVVVEATYSDGSTGTIAKGYFTSPPNPTDTLGEVIPVTVYYKGRESSFNIKVIDSSEMFDPLTSITAVPDKSPAAYTFNEPYVITVNAFYGESTVPHQVLEFTTDPVNITSTRDGTVTVEVSYRDGEITKKASFNIFVKPILIGSTDGGGDAILNLESYVNVPEAKVQPDFVGGFNPYFVVEPIVWHQGTNSINKGSVFEPVSIYTATVTLTPQPGYTFQDINSGAFKHAGATPGKVTNAPNSGIVTIEFPATQGEPGELKSLTVSVTGSTTGPAGVLTPAFSSNIREYTFISYSKGNLQFIVKTELAQYSSTSFVSPYQTNNIAPGSFQDIDIQVVGTIASTMYKVRVMNGVALGGTLDFANVNNKWSEIHKFTSGDNSLKVNKVVYGARVLVVAGGGGGGGTSNWPAGGGGAGGYLESGGFNFNIGTYGAHVGGGGEPGYRGNDDGENGGDSWFGTMSSYGTSSTGIKTRGGGGGGETHTYGGIRYGSDGHNGGSGGGAGYDEEGGGNQAGQGFSGGSVTSWGDNHAGSGGGAGGNGSMKTAKNNTNQGGGAGKDSDITGKKVRYASGGPVSDNYSTQKPGNNGAANTGDGGMGGWQSAGGWGGSGVVIVSIPLN